jgi:lipoprotein-anchoring transpeptidase ErfK/SrfK
VKPVISSGASVRIPRVILRRAHAIALAGMAAAVTCVALAAPAAAQLPEVPGDPGAEPPAAATLTVDVDGLKNGRVTAGHRVHVRGTISPLEAGQKVEITLAIGDHAIKQQVVEVKQAKNGKGEFHLKGPQMAEPGDYRARVKFDGSSTAGAAEVQSNPFSVRYPSLRKGNKGADVALLNNLLAKQGYATSSGKKYTQVTAWGVLAFRKVNGMSRVQNATSGIFRTLAEGKGAYQVQHPGAGRHAEVSLAKQVLVLIEGDKPKLTFPISSGAMATPSDAGGYRFYRKDPGFNSLGMYYSVYYNRGEATHGYHSVPTHPASHGCIRIPIPQARQVYNWVQIGMPIFVE